MTDLSFQPGQTSKSFAVAVKGDALDEPNESFKVDMWGATNATFADDPAPQALHRKRQQGRA